jgi:molecular chaperone Hsp33
MTDTDFTQRFIFDNHDARGELASLEQSYAHVLAKHDYPEPVRILLGELMAAAALLVGSLKFDGLLTLQVRGDGPLSLLVVECSSNREMRGLARYDAGRVHGGASLQELMPDSVLAMTVDPEGGQRRARGVLLQQLPAAQVPQGEQRAASWQHLTTLAQTLSAEELLGLDNSTVLHRLYHEEDVRLFDAQQVQFSCNCSRERSQKALLSLGEHDVLALLQEQNGSIEMDCQFCNQHYSFTAADIRQLFEPGQGSDGPSTVH